ncbi:MAG: DUF4190 domain-containing protein [Luteimonas sp.]
MSTVRDTSPLALVSLIAGVLGLTLMPLLGSVVAIITGHIARSDIRRAPERLSGDGLAVTGLALGYAAVLLAVFAVVAMVLFFGGLAWFASTAH